MWTDTVTVILHPHRVGHRLDSVGSDEEADREQTPSTSSSLAGLVSFDEDSSTGRTILAARVISATVSRIGSYTGLASLPERTLAKNVIASYLIWRVLGQKMATYLYGRQVFM